MEQAATTLTHLETLCGLRALASSLSSVLEVYAEAWAETEVGDWTAPLVKESALALVVYAYHHFGLGSLGPLGRRGLGRRLESWIGLEADFVEQWLGVVAGKLVGEILGDDAEGRSIFWGDIDKAYARDLVKRSLSVQREEALRVGLFAWDEKGLDSLYACSLESLAAIVNSESGGVTTSTNAAGARPSPSGGGAEESFAEMEEALAACLVDVARNPLCLFYWRTEAFARLKPLSKGVRVSLRREERETESLLLPLCAIIIALSPLKGNRAQSRLPESPCSRSKLEKAFAAHVGLKSLSQGCQGAGLEEVLHFGVESGLLYRVEVRSNRAEFGLSARGLQVAEPFLDMLAALVLDEPVVSAPPASSLGTDLAP